MGRNNVPSPTDCHAMFAYDRMSGRLFWKHRDAGPEWWNTRYAGKEAFTSLDTDGYRQGKINGKPVRAQYVVWVMHWGDAFPECIDHINRVRTDNRIENLRSATQQQNAVNRSTNTAGHVGIYRCGSRWRARVRVMGVLHNVGSFANIEDAIAARAGAVAALRRPW